MAAVPKRRISTRRKGKRRAAINLHEQKTTPCPSCQEPKFSHRACTNCGVYKT